MAFKTFADLDVLFAADVNTYLMKQAVIVCTTGTRPASPVSGMTIWQTDNLRYAVYGTAWCETTPVSATTIDTRETMSSATFAALATAQSVSVTTGTKATVAMSCNADSTTSANNCYMGFAVTGATTLAAAVARAALAQTAGTVGEALPLSRRLALTGLTAGVNAFAAQHSNSAAVSTGFQKRGLEVTGTPT